jgi:Fungal specific transcription factor domain
MQRLRGKCLSVERIFPLTLSSLRFFAASRCLVDLSHCTDETALQTIVFLDLFFIETARAGTCYSYLTHTLTLALRMGLHRSMPKDQDLIRSEVGKRAFWTIRLLANYFATLVGMPKLLGDDYVDQDLPTEANDIYITDVKISPHPANEVCHIAGMNAYVKLHNILGQVVRHIYPLRGISKTPGKESVGYLVSIEKIRAIEETLKEWTETVPHGFRLGKDPATGSLLR